MTHMLFRSGWMACTALSLVFLSEHAPAQEAGGATMLETIVVKTTKKTARQKLDKGAADTPLASETKAQTIRQKDINSIKDLGSTTEAGLDYAETRTGAAGGMYLRGLGGARIATLIDDIPIPYLETLTRTGSASPTTGIGDSSDSYDFSALSSVDVVRGADSSRIGSGAMGGAIVLNTLEPEDLIREGKDWGGVVKSGFDSKDMSFGGSVALARKLGDTSVLLQSSYTRGQETDNQGSADVIGSSRTKKNPADTYQRSVMFKFRQDLEGGHRVGFTAERFDRNVDTDLKTLQSTTGTTTYRVGDYWGYEDTTRDRVSLDYEYEAPEAGGLIDAAKLTPYWQRLVKESGSHGMRNNNTNYLRDNTTEESSLGLTGGTISTFETGALDHTLRFGGNVQFFQYEQYVTAVTAGVSSASQADVPNVDGKQLGLYLDDEIAVADTGLTVTPGLRFDWYDYDPEISAQYLANTGYSYFGIGSSQSGSKLSPKLLLTYQATDELKLFAQWSMSYRAPTVTELYSNFTNVAGGYGVVGNPTLKAETGNGFEVGADYEAGDLTGKITLFHNRYKNFIDDTSTYTSAYPAGYYPQFLYMSWANRNRVHISGVEVKGRKEFDNGFFVHGSLAYTYGKDQDTGEFIRTVAPFKAITGLGYQQETWGTELTGIFSAAMRDDHVSTTYDAPAYGIANLTGWWEPESLKGLRVQAGVYNIFDKKYWNAVGVRDINPTSVGSSNQPVDYYTEAGRSFKISLTKTF